MTRAYLDHASTTPPRPEALAALIRWMALPAADPGRLHQEGRTVRDALEEARQQVAWLVGATPREIVFTSGGTESINAAVWGATRRRPGAPVLCADVEHSAVRDASARLAPTEVLPVDGAALVQTDALEARLRATDVPRPALVHCQWANHEVGTLQPVRETVRLCRDAGVPVHVDAAAACGHVPLDLDDLGADLVSLSAHKIGGLPGAGALVVRRGSRFEPLIVGGEQERARRAGLEALPALLAFGAAAAALGDDGQRLLRSEARSARRHIDALETAATAVPGVELVGPRAEDQRLPSLLCLGCLLYTSPQRQHQPVRTLPGRRAAQEPGLVGNELGLHPAVGGQERRRVGVGPQMEDGDLDDGHYCCTNMTGLPSGSLMAARVGPPGTSKGSSSKVAPSATDLSIEARRSPTWM